MLLNSTEIIIKGNFSNKILYVQCSPLTSKILLFLLIYFNAYRNSKSARVTGIALKKPKWSTVLSANKCSFGDCKQNYYFFEVILNGSRYLQILHCYVTSNMVILFLNAFNTSISNESFWYKQDDAPLHYTADIK